MAHRPHCGEALAGLPLRPGARPSGSGRRTWVSGSMSAAWRMRWNVWMDPGKVAALAIDHGLEVCSNDSEFARFGEVRWINPVAPD
jgi:uncharacterized protein